MHNPRNENGNGRILRQLACVLAVTISAYAVPFSAIAQPASAAAASAAAASAAAASAAAATANAASDAPMKMHKSMDTMQKKMSSMQMTGNLDIDFAMMMVAHHQGAIDMAQAQVDAGKDPVMVKAARNIIAAQKKEIAQFENWLKQHPHTMK